MAIITAAAKALGGIGSTNKIRKLQMEWEGQKYMDGQSRSFNKPLDSLPVQLQWGIDFTTGQLFNETAERYLGGYLFHFRSVYADTTAFSFEVPKIRFSGITPLPKEGRLQVQQSLLRNLPNYLIKAALEKKQSLRYQGVVTENGRKMEVVSFAYTAGLVLDLYLDAATHLLTKYALFTDHPIHGDQQVVYAFFHYQASAGVQFPALRTVTSNGQLMRVERLQHIRVNEPIDNGYFERPGGYGTPVSVATKMREIGRNVFMIEGLNGYNPVFINFSDHLIFLEAVGASDKAIEMAKQRFPGKPVRYVAFSHYHEDHTIGLADFIKEGATIISSKENRSYLAHLLTATHSLQASVRPEDLKGMDVHAFPKTFSDTNATVMLLPFGPNSHADDLLVYYFPEAKALYQADLLISTDDGHVARPILPVNKELYRFIISNKLAVDTIYGVHWKSIPFAELENAVLEEVKEEKR